MQFAKHTLFFCCLFLWKTTGAVLNNRNAAKSFVKNYNHHRDITIHKVSFTQKGYIQFLKYISHVPPLTEYTFCIWVRSNNLTYSHPLLSYSKHEEERLIRVWISPHGTDINLEILEHHLFKIPIHFVENHWYHICQSWSSYQASWNLYLNGKLKSSGIEPQLRGVIIKGDGDIVVGQEYTDFDKGLDDGIEGDVFGFNFVLSPTSFAPIVDFPLRRHYQRREEGLHKLPPLISRPANDVPGVLSYFTIEPNRRQKGIVDVFNDVFNFFDPPTIRVQKNKQVRFGPRIINDIDDFTPKPTGLKLVELSYNCFLGRGAPLSGEDVLISWTRSPVRVFGGAILKTIPPFCT
ncbi:neuronal pentraxin receptor-like [Asbolus verrucosus]|uniref:Neuronal pentraxin receptor-like n=1 Tax=Asbolus verrucosus TaxID=1661398 RepID=A0A482VFI0_ASBVE|nr:neuronal pentraxin receptor-like [Asbolus verrucosus]